MTRSLRSTVAIVVFTLTAGMLLLLRAAGDEDVPPTTSTESKASEPSSASQLYELRIYTAARGKMEALHQRFRDHTLKFFEKHGIKSVGYWEAETAKGEKQLYYLIAYPDRTSREKMLVKGIAADPEFLKVVAESEVGGKLTAGIESVLLSPTDYSPLR